MLFVVWNRAHCHTHRFYRHGIAYDKNISALDHFYSSTILANCTFEIFSLCHSSSLWRAYFFLLARVSFCVCLLHLKPFAGWKALVLNARCACHTEVTRGIQIVYWIESGQEVRIKRIDCISPFIFNAWIERTINHTILRHYLYQTSSKCHAQMQARSASLCHCIWMALVWHRMEHTNDFFDFRRENTNNPKTKSQLNKC